jgi:hypothetical protein
MQPFLLPQMIAARLDQFACAWRDCDREALRGYLAAVSGSLGTCRRRITGRPADGATYEVEGIDAYEFSGDRIRSEDVYRKP